MIGESRTGRSLGSLFNNDPAPANLIREYLPTVARSVNFWQRKFPSDDMEVVLMTALYRAAYTWRPGPAGFFHWYIICLRSGIATVRRKYQRRARGLMEPGRGSHRRLPPVHQVQLRPDLIDSRYYYY